MALIDLVGGSDYIAVSRTLCKNIGPAEAILYSEIIDQYKFYKKANKLDNNQMFYALVEDITEKTGLSADQQPRLLKKLEAKGLIKVVYKGLPRKRFIWVDENPEYLKTVYNDDEARNIQKPDFAATSNREMQELVTAKSGDKSPQNPAETNLINKPNTNLNNNVVEIFSEHDIDIRPVLKKHPGIFDDFSAQEISKVARTLKNKTVKGKIQNPVGIILANPDILRTILTGEFYAEKKQAGKAYFSEYTTYVPPDIF